MAELSPPTLDDYIGQRQLKINLRTIFASLEKRLIFDDPMDHTLLSGPPGLGKTSLAEIIAQELQCPIIKLMGPQLNINSLDVLKNILPWTFVFIDEIHALPIKVEEALYEPIDDRKWKGQSINKFTLIGATTKEGLVSKPLRSRFTIAETLTPYSINDLNEIISRSATIMKLSIDDKAVEAIAKRSRGTPRVANQLLKRLSYYSANITASLAQDALDSLGVDEFGLEMLDRNILTTILQSFGGGPVGIDSLSSVTNEDVATIEAREPYLVNVGFVQRTGKGRVLTASGLTYVRSNS
jgi:Holliday junction DNA helicase RuvB